METKYGSEHLQIEKTEGLQSYTDFSAFGFAGVVSNLPGVLGSEGGFGIPRRKEYFWEGSGQKTSLKCLFHEGHAAQWYIRCAGCDIPIEPQGRSGTWRGMKSFACIVDMELKLCFPLFPCLEDYPVELCTPSRACRSDSAALQSSASSRGNFFT